MPSAFTHRVLALLAAFLLLPASARAADPFKDKVRPFLNEYCVRCHKADKKGGDLDLTRFDTAAKLLEDFRQSEHIVTFLKKEEMPPATAQQPTAALRKEMIATIEQVLLTEARKMAGDPGVVPPRRLTNAEYDYTIRDLTGADIRPAKAFPIDPASGEGFNNTGEALTMSPALFKKYYAAAEFVSDHAVLTTEGLKFAPHQAVAFADRQKFYEQQIIHFYETHAVDHAKYFTELWLYKHRGEEKKSTSIEQWAEARGLSPKFARSLWDALEDWSGEAYFVGWMRNRWRDFPTPKNAASPTAAEVQAAAKALATEAQKLGKELAPVEARLIIPDAGNGPIEHLARRRKIAETRDTADAAAFAAQKTTVEYKNVTALPVVKVVIELDEATVNRAAGYVVVKGTFQTGAKTTSGKQKWTLRELLAEYDPGVLAKLQFGKHADPKGEKIDGDSFVLKGLKTLEIELPAKAFPLAAKGDVTFTAECRLDRTTPGFAIVRVADRKAHDPLPVVRPLISPDHPAAAKFEASASAFCKLFPSRFVYVDDTRGLSAGFHLIEGFFRDDVPLCKSVLSAAENAELDRLWRELYFVTGIWEKMLRGFVFFERSERNFLKHKDFDDFKEEDPELTKDEHLARFQEVYLRRANVKLTGAELEKHPITVFFTEVRAGLRGQTKTLKKAEPQYLKDLLSFAERAYRRPLTDAERAKLEKFYAGVCANKDHGTEAAVRATVTRILVSPHFCMRFDSVAVGESVAPLPDLALASRLSYFIWSGPPDAELLALAKAGKLRDEVVLRGQVKRMLQDEKVSRFALEFFGQWLGHREFLSQESVNRQAFPMFDDALKQAMFEEPTRLITHLIQKDRPITELLSGDATFVNKKLSQHYGLPFTASGDEWQYVTGLREKGRGGALGMAVFLTKNSQPQRTSPVKRGFWVVHKLLGEHIPPPPPDVAVLPAKETEGTKTVRELLKLHVSDAKCANCHQRFDPVGLSMEGFDPIGRARAKDLAGRPIDNVVALPNGKTARGVPEFGTYLATHRKAEFTKTLCQKFLGYALGRSLQLSDQVLLDKMQSELEKNDYKLSVLFDLVTTSPQFRNQRCKDFTPAKFSASNPTGAPK